MARHLPAITVVLVATDAVTASSCCGGSGGGGGGFGRRPPKPPPAKPPGKRTFWPLTVETANKPKRQSRRTTLERFMREDVGIWIYRNTFFVGQNQYDQRRRIDIRSGSDIGSFVLYLSSRTSLRTSSTLTSPTKRSLLLFLRPKSPSGWLPA